MVTHETGAVVDHLHDDYMTEAQLKGWLARWLIGVGAGIALTVGSAVVWAAQTESRMDAHERRIEEVRQEGSLPLQDLRRDLALLSAQMGTLARELAETRAALAAQRP